MLDKRALSPVGYPRYSKKAGREVCWDDVVKGFEYDKDRYVVVSDEDFRRANVTKAPVARASYYRGHGRCGTGAYTRMANGPILGSASAA